MYEKSGMLSNQKIFFLHLGQKDLPLTNPTPFGILYVTAPRNDPTIKPSNKTNITTTIVI